MNGVEALRIARFLFADSGKRPPASHGQEVSEPPVSRRETFPHASPAVARFRESRFFVKFEGF